MTTSVDRYLKDKAMDRIDHALGRPVDPTVESYRNHFAVDDGSPTAKAFEQSSHWKRGRRCGDMLFFHVTDEGRKALKQHLQDIGDKHRLFYVLYRGTTNSVVAISAAKARYSFWLSISDCFPDLKFGAFCRSASVRQAPLTVSPFKELPF